MQDNYEVEALVQKYNLQNCTDWEYTQLVLDSQQSLEPEGVYSFDFEFEDEPGDSEDLLEIRVERGRVQLEKTDRFQLYEWNRIAVVAQNVASYLGLINGYVFLRAPVHDLKLVSCMGFPSAREKKMLKDAGVLKPWTL